MWWWDLDWYRGWGSDWSTGAIASIAIGLFIGLAVWTAVEFFFLRNLRDLLLQVGVRNRVMPPGHVWLNFIPVFSFVWMIYTVIQIRRSVLRELWSRGYLVQGDLGFGVGVAYAILVLVSWSMDWIPGSSVSLMAELIGLGGFVCWIVYWAKTSSLKNLLIIESESTGGGPDREPEPPRDDDDDRGPPLGTCKVCGAPYHEGDMVCSDCGEPLP